MARKKLVTLSVLSNLDPQTRRRARRGIGLLASINTSLQPSRLVTLAGGIRPAARLSGLSINTCSALAKSAERVSIRSYQKLAEALGFSVELRDGKAERWKTLHASQFHAWETPPALLQAVLSGLRVDRFDLDPCSPRKNGPVPAHHHYTVTDDGLSLPWTGYIWVNPPYGSSLPKWVNKAMEEGARGTGIIMLVPARTGTRWWHRALDGGAVPIFMRGRLKFWRDGKEGNAAPFDTALLTFGLDAPQVNDVARQIQGKL